MPTGFFVSDIWDECKVILEPLRINNKPNGTQKENKFKCRKCGKLYKICKSLERHQIICQKRSKYRLKNNSEYRCNGCNRTFFSKDQLARHRVTGRSKNCAYNEVYKKTRRGTQYNTEK